MASNIDPSTIATSALLVAVSHAGTLAIQNNFDAVKTAVSTAKTEITGLQLANTDLYTTGNLAKGAALVGFTPAGSLSSTNVQAAIAEINSDLLAVSGANLVGYSDVETYSASTAGSAIKSRVISSDLSNNSDIARGAALVGYSGTTVYDKLNSLSTTDGVTETLTHVYFTEDRVRSTILTGLSTLDSTAISATDSVLQGFGKLAARIDLRTKQSFLYICSDETTAITASPGKVTQRVPYNFTLTEVRASLTTAQVSGTIFTVDIKKNGVSIFSTLLTIDNSELTSVTATTAAVLSTTSLASDDEIKVDVTQIGDSTATGLKVMLIGCPS